jgi:hypothetical protein
VFVWVMAGMVAGAGVRLESRIEGAGHYTVRHRPVSRCRLPAVDG